MTSPALRDRGNDVLLMAEYFLDKFSREFAKAGLELSADAKERLLEYRWPGNVRELQNTLERAVILADGLSIRANGLQLPSAKPDAESLPAGARPGKICWDCSLEEITPRGPNTLQTAVREGT